MYLAKNWRPLLEKYNLLTGTALWHYPVEWYEEPNTSRGGMSGVAKMKLVDDQGEVKHLFLKKQCNYRTKSLRHPIVGEPTLALELKNIKAYQQKNISTATPVFYDEFSSPKGQCAVLLMESLEGYQDLAFYLKKWRTANWQPRQEIAAILHRIAETLHSIHKAGFMHNCFYPKHIFIGKNKQSIDVAIIDLEKNKWFPWGQRRVMRDLESLYSRAGAVPLRWQVYFLKSYFTILKLSKPAKKLGEKIINRALKRRIGK